MAPLGSLPSFHSRGGPPFRLSTGLLRLRPCWWRLPPDNARGTAGSTISVVSSGYVQLLLEQYGWWWSGCCQGRSAAGRETARALPGGTPPRNYPSPAGKCARRETRAGNGASGVCSGLWIPNPCPCGRTLGGLPTRAEAPLGGFRAGSRRP